MGADALREGGPFSFAPERNMAKQTPLYAAHLAAGAKMVDFAGWDMPIHYGSLLEEHKQVRRDAGMFDVSHMLAIDVSGAGARVFLQYVLPMSVIALVGFFYFVVPALQRRRLRAPSRLKAA